MILFFRWQQRPYYFSRLYPTITIRTGVAVWANKNLQDQRCLNSRIFNLHRVCPSLHWDPPFNVLIQRTLHCIISDNDDNGTCSGPVIISLWTGTESEISDLFRILNLLRREEGDRCTRVVFRWQLVYRQVNRNPKRLSSKGITLKGKNFLPLGANSLLLEQISFQIWNVVLESKLEFAKVTSR